MTDQQSDISIEEAKASLNALSDAHQKTNLALRPPLWLNLILALSAGFQVYGMASARHENFWGLFGGIAMGFFILAVIFYIYRSRLLGITPREMPDNKAEWWYVIAITIGAAGLNTLARTFSGWGYPSLVILISAITGTLVFVMFRFFPGGMGQVKKQ